MQQPYAFGPPPPAKKSNTVAIVLIVIGSVVVLGVLVVGALVVMAISGTRKYVAAAKTAEAKNTVGEIARDATAAYEREDIDLKTGTTVMHKLCPAASHPVPSSISDVRGKKYMSAPTDWTDDSAKNAGFYCLKFEMMMPQYYQYDYRLSGKSFTAEAKGDLDGDGNLSSFSVTGTVGAGDMITLAPMKETDGDE